MEGVLKSDISVLSLEPPEERIDLYWRELFSLKDNHGHLKFKNLARLIKTVLILPHGNADPERGFSINKSLLDINHSENTIKSLRLIKDAIKGYGSANNIPITSSLLAYVKNSYKSYQEYMKKLKEEEEKLKKVKKNAEKEDIEQKTIMKRKCDLELKVKNCESEISELRKKKQIAHGLIKEGSERLSKAVANQNSVEMGVAQNLIAQGSAQLDKLESKLADL